MSSTRKTALAAGILFALTFITATAGGLLYRPVLNNANYIIGAGADTRVTWGALFEVLLVVTNIGTAIVLFPILKRQNVGLALAYVVARAVEAMFIVVGILSILAVVSLRHAGATGTEAVSLLVTGRSLVAINKGTLLLGQGLLGPGATGLVLGWLMYRSGLVSRTAARLGLVGGALVVASGIAVLFGAYGQSSGWSAVATVPEILWEGAVLSIWLIVKGFRPSPITDDAASVGADGRSPALAATAG